MVGQIPIGKEREFASCSRLVLQHRYIRLKQTLAVNISFHIFRSSPVLAENTEFCSCVFHRRQVGVQYVGVSDTVEGRTCNDTVLLCICLEKASTQKEQYY